MSIKINISYESEKEIEPILELLEPIKNQYKMKRKEAGKYKHLYLAQKNEKGVQMFG